MITGVPAGDGRPSYDELAALVVHQGARNHFQAEAEQRHQLRRCLTDDALPLEVRIIGALIRL